MTTSNPNSSTIVTTYGYQSSAGTADPFWRVSSVTDPLGNKVWKSYTATSLNSSFSFNSSIDNTTVTTDGYGRAIRTQTQQGPSASNYDTVSTAYGWSTNYNTVATSQPCSATVGGSCSTVHTNYMDPLGRLYQESTTSNETLTHTYTQNDDLAVLTPAPSGENSAGKQVQKQFDGLGRLTSSCEISSTVGGNALCNQNTNTTAKGIGTTTSYTSAAGSQTVSFTRGSQTRSQTVDGLGRVTSSTTPEGGMTTYAYDGTACGSGVSYPGHLTNISYANGTVVCDQYNDALGRKTDSEGSGTSGGYCKRWRYDSTSNGVVAQPSGSTISDAAGRLVEAETDNCSAWPPTPITDEWFSYDKDGHVTDMWEKTPHSGTYYHSVATFAGNGVPLTVQLANPSLYTMTYGLDGEGRPNTLKGNSTTIVSGTTFNASSQPTYIDLGTGTDQSDYIYDPDTGRMTNWTFQVGSTGSETGTLTWNPNGTLKILAINDGFNVGGTQTCNFNPSLATGTGYDDVGRLVGIDCGSGGWGQTFSFDQYDNLAKAVISGRTGVTWSPGYNSSNNHYNIGSYDGSGNVTSDTFHTYVWDGYGKLSTIDSSTCGTNGECVTYDAMGRAVETSYNSAYTEIWYTQLGKVYMTGGTTPYYAYWPTPGNGTAEVNGNAVTFFYMHKDWVGNSRISSVIVNPFVVSDQAYAPYGDVYDKLATGAGVPGQMFTGDTQDILTGIFHTPNRELNASQGRWLSPDPAGAGWNQYAYVTNPTSNTDPSGLYTNSYNYSLGDLHNCAFSGPIGCGSDGGGWNEFDVFAIASKPLTDDDGNPITIFPLHGLAWVPGSSLFDPVTQDFYAVPGYFTYESIDWNNPYYYYPSASATALINPPAAANNGPSWIGTFFKTLVKGPSTGPGSCLGVFTDTVAAPLKQLQSAAKNYVPLIVGAMQSGPVGSAWYMSQLNNMVASGAAEADPQVAAVVTTAGAAAATAAPYVSAAAPYLAPVGGDAVLLNGVIKEVQSGMSGQCTW